MGKHKGTVDSGFHWIIPLVDSMEKVPKNGHMYGDKPTITCPFCGTGSIPFDANICPYCGVPTSSHWRGYLIIVDPRESKIAQKMHIKTPGKYALKVI